MHGVALRDEARRPRRVAAGVLPQPVPQGGHRARVASGLPPLHEQALGPCLLPVAAQATCFSGSAKAAASRRRSLRCVIASTVAGTIAIADIATAHQKVDPKAEASGSATRKRTTSRNRPHVPRPPPPAPPPPAAPVA